jgi:hypothetical protein
MDCQQAGTHSSSSSNILMCVLSLRAAYTELGTSGFRQELLQAAADEAAAQAASKAATTSGSSAAAGHGSSSTGGGLGSPAGGASDKRSAGGLPEGSGMSFKAASASLRDLLK